MSKEKIETTIVLSILLKYSTMLTDIDNVLPETKREQKKFLKEFETKTNFVDEVMHRLSANDTDDVYVKLWKSVDENINTIKTGIENESHDSLMLIWIKTQSMLFDYSFISEQTRKVSYLLNHLMPKVARLSNLIIREYKFLPYKDNTDNVLFLNTLKDSLMLNNEVSKDELGELD